VLVELSVMEQRYQAVLAVQAGIPDGDPAASNTSSPSTGSILSLSLQHLPLRRHGMIDLRQRRKGRDGFRRLEPSHADLADGRSGWRSTRRRDRCKGG